MSQGQGGQGAGLRARVCVTCPGGSSEQRCMEFGALRPKTKRESVLSLIQGCFQSGLCFTRSHRVGATATVMSVGGHSSGELWAFQPTL